MNTTESTGRRGRQLTDSTEARKEASRQNGKLGGRPVARPDTHEFVVNCLRLGMTAAVIRDRLNGNDWTLAQINNLKAYLKRRDEL